VIFKKILKGTDLAFDMKLEKTQYTPGETVRGTLSIKTEKGSKARKLVLLAEGRESTTITVTESTGIGNRQDTTSKTYSENNLFFSKDLSYLLQQSIIHDILQDGALEILPQNKVIAFDFILPADNNILFSSYKGKHANITYTVKGTVDIAKKLDANKEEQFSVIHPKNITIGHSSTSTSNDRENNNDTINPDNTENRKNNLPSPTTESEEKDVDKGTYEARFEQIFGKRANAAPSKKGSRYLTRFTRVSMSFDLETIFAKGREDFLKESDEAKINLIDQSNNIKSYSPGHVVEGDVVNRPLHTEEEEIRNKVRGLKITLSGIEHAFAQGLQRVSTIEKYDKNIELNGNEIGGKNDNNAMRFELVIPQGINKSYIGKYSEYFWGLEAKVNIAWSSDLIAKTIIEIE
jgi:Arrestin (or S-antigen), N-terminal domain